MLAALGPLLLLLGCALVFHGPGLVGGPVFFESDTMLFYYPFTDWFAEQLRAGRLPHWTPTSFGGYPLLADGEIGPLYPLHWLVLPFVPSGPAFVLLRAVHTALAAILAYGLLRVLGVGRIGGLVAGLVFGFGSFLIGQLQHENMVRSAVWLPGQLLLLELAFRRRGWARQRLLVGTGVLVGMACLGLHVQAVVMSLLALVLYAAYRLLVEPSDEPLQHRGLLLVWAPVVVTGVGVSLAAAQWLPLLELGQDSPRGPGLPYHLAATYALAPLNLPSLLFPYFFRGQDGLWWSFWHPWETLPYVGIAPLALGVLALVRPVRRPVWYFAGLVLFGLWVALAYHAPLNLHELLWRLPGFPSLRAPGRFTFLFVLGLAGLAAFGTDALVRSAGHRRPAAAVGGVLLALVPLLVALFAQVRERLLTDPGWGQQVANLRYLSLPHQNPELQAHQVHEGLVFSLDLANGRTALALGLMLMSGLLLVARWRWPARAQLCGGALVGLSGLDLLVFGLGYHRRATLAEITAQPPVNRTLGQQPDNGNVFAEPVLRELRPNRLTLSRARDLRGYSSLQSRRHQEYVASIDWVDNTLLDLWHGRYYVAPVRRTDVLVVEGTAYRPSEVLLSGGAGNPTGWERFRIEPVLSGEIRLLAALANATSVLQGTRVAEVTVLGEDGQRASFFLRAGLEVSEHAIDRPDVAPRTAHGRARIVAGLPDTAPDGRRFTSNIYYASFPLNPPFAVREVQVRALLWDGYVRLWGLGLVEPGGTRVRSLFADDKAKYEHPPLYQDADARLYRNTAAFPRAFVVPEALAQGRRSEESALIRMALRPFNPWRQAVLEAGPFDDVPLAAAPRLYDGPEADPGPGAAAVIDHQPAEVEVRARGPGVLVLTDAYHRGWRAYLADGRELPVYLANHTARAVGLPPGDQRVRFIFDPRSWRLGVAISLVALGSTLVVLSSGLVARPRLLQRSSWWSS